ncbi:hypothetical protein L3Q82_010457 [Scortum barcoo]|uniref:Uncharacterized protein n=1 Tax=Scortum barcoo TaxID=214431 RepID=A0ACB8WC05_9TELE|nr:hypothetical protein L3Q82_010457 [Scortum barcoo]
MKGQGITKVIRIYPLGTYTLTVHPQREKVTVEGHFWSIKRPHLGQERFTSLSFVPWEGFPGATLGEGRYTWWHNQVLKSIAETISKATANNKYVCHQRNMNFVKAGEQPHTQPKPAAGLFTSALDWELRVDLGRQLSSRTKE